MFLSTEKYNIENMRKNIENPMCCLIFKTCNDVAYAYQYTIIRGYYMVIFISHPI